MKHQKQGFTLVEIMIVVMIIGLLAAIALPGFQKARESAQANACINNQRQIESAIDQYAIEQGLQQADGVTEAGLTDYLKEWPSCPVGDTTYTVSTVAAGASCPNSIAEHSSN